MRRGGHRVGGLLAPLVSTLSRLRLAEELERLRGEHAVAVPALAWLTRREREIAGGDGSYPVGG